MLHFIFSEIKILIMSSLSVSSISLLLVYATGINYDLTSQDPQSLTCSLSLSFAEMRVRAMCP